MLCPRDLPLRPSSSLAPSPVAHQRHPSASASPPSLVFYAELRYVALALMVLSLSGSARRFGRRMSGRLTTVLRFVGRPDAWQLDGDGLCRHPATLGVRVQRLREGKTVCCSAPAALDECRLQRSATDMGRLLLSSRETSASPSRLPPSAFSLRPLTRQRPCGKLERSLSLPPHLSRLDTRLPRLAWPSPPSPASSCLHLISRAYYRRLQHVLESHAPC